MRSQRGFTIAELAIAAAILALLLGGMLAGITSQLDSRQTSETQRTLEQVREALVGFAIANGRLPCPATALAGTGVEQFTGAVCSARNGFVPAATLGLTPTDAQGYLLDAYNNRVRYSVTNDNAFTTSTVASQIKGVVAASGFSALSPDLVVCSTSTGMTNVGNQTTADCAAASRLSTTAVAVIFSTGRNFSSSGGGGTTAAGNDEARNLDADRAFVWHTRTESGAVNGEFDDIVLWLSPNTLYARMAAAGAL